MAVSGARPAVPWTQLDKGRKEKRKPDSLFQVRQAGRVLETAISYRVMGAAGDAAGRLRRPAVSAGWPWLPAGRVCRPVAFRVRHLEASAGLCLDF